MGCGNIQIASNMCGCFHYEGKKQLAWLPFIVDMYDPNVYNNWQLSAWWCYNYNNCLVGDTNYFFTLGFAVNCMPCVTNLIFLLRNPKYSHTWSIMMIKKRRSITFFNDIFKFIFFNGKVRIAIKISLVHVPKGPIDNKPLLVQIMAWRDTLGNMPLSQPNMVYSTDAYMHHSTKMS